MVCLFELGLVVLLPVHPRLAFWVCSSLSRLMVGLFASGVCWAVVGGVGWIAVLVVHLGRDGQAGLHSACSAPPPFLVGTEGLVS